MFSNFPAPQPFSKPPLTSPFFMFLSDQQKANKAQSADIKLLDLAANATKEWDDVVTIRDEYTAKFLQESGQSDSPILPNVQQSPLIFQPQNKREPMIYVDMNGKPVPPKRPLSQWFLYKEDNFAKVKDENPTLKVTEITKILAKNWGNVDQQTKSYYEAKEQEAKAFYEQDMKFYESTYGKQPASLLGSGR